MGLNIYKLLLANKFLLFVCKQVDHPGETGRNWLLELCCHQYGYCCKVDNILFEKVLYTDSINIPIKDSCGNEKCFTFVIFFLMQVEYFLDTIGPFMCCKILFILWLLVYRDSILDTLSKRELFIAFWYQV